MEWSDTRTNYLTATHGLRSWTLTLDHKRVALLYLVAVTGFFALGALLAAGLRVELLTPRGEVFLADTFNKLFTMHGIVMVFFFLVPAVPCVLGNFLLPLMIGARNVAFPRWNLAAWYLFVLAGLMALYAMFIGGVDAGWTFLAPYSTAVSPTHVAPMALAVAVAGLSFFLTGVNLLATIHRMRAPEMTWLRLPLFVWALYGTGILMVIASPVLVLAMLLLAWERTFQAGLFDPARGGSPLLFQHLFWFAGNAVLYVMLLPGMGVVSEILPCFSRKPIFGYATLAGCSLAIALLALLGWGQHLFVSGLGVDSALVFSFLALAMAVPVSLKVFNWTATLYRGAVSFEAPMLYALGFVGLLIVGGLSGVFPAAAALGVQLHGTQFVSGQLHYLLAGAAITAYLAGLHFWWPKMTGRMYHEWAARVAAGVLFVGVNLTFLPQLLLGYLGMPDRYHSYPGEFQVLQVMSTAGASILGVAYLLPLVYLIWSARYGTVAAANPWQASGLEWQTPSPAPAQNFLSEPRVPAVPYAYGREHDAAA